VTSCSEVTATYLGGPLCICTQWATFNFRLAVSLSVFAERFC